MKVQIVVDSTSDMTPQVASRVMCVPMTIHFGQQEYVSGVDMDHRRFYEMLVESDVLPTTSQASPFAFESVFRQALQSSDEVVCITCSSILSGTCQSARIAAGEFGGRVHVVDSNTIAIGLGILTEYALELADRGFRAEEIVWNLLQKRDKVRMLALVDTLEYLKKGGRISSTAALAGSLLNIKPVITINAGQIQVLGKARGSRQANNLLMQQIEACGGVDFKKPVLLGYTGLSDALLHKYIADSAPMWQDHRSGLDYTLVGSVVGTHVGPGAIAVAFFAADPAGI